MPAMITPPTVPKTAAADFFVNPAINNMLLAMDAKQMKTALASGLKPCKLNGSKTRLISKTVITNPARDFIPVCTKEYECSQEHGQEPAQDWGAVIISDVDFSLSRPVDTDNMTCCPGFTAKSKAGSPLSH